MQKIISLLFAIIICIGNTYAFGESFTGKMEVISFQNIDKSTIRFSSGIGYNGACNEVVLVKDNIVLVENISLKYTTLLNPKNKKVYIWCTPLGEGIIVDYDEYLAIFSTYSNIERYYLGVKLQNYVYDITADSTPRNIFDKAAIFYQGRIECKSSGVDVKCEVIPSIQSPLALQCVLQNGFNVQGLVTKFMWTIDTRFLGIKLKGYKGMDVQSIDWEYIPSDEELSIPTSIRFEEKKSSSVHGFYKKISKYLKKNHLFPNQTGEEFIYEINEDEWI